MIFETRSNRRRWILRIGITGALLGAVALLAALLLGVFTNPSFRPALRLPNLSVKAARNPTELEHATADAAAPAATAAPPAPASRPSHETFRQKAFLHTAFVATDDPQSLADLANHAHALDAVFPTWFGVAKADGELVRRAPPEATRLVCTGTTLVLPVVSNTDAEGNWHPDELASLIDNPAASNRLIEHLRDEVNQLHADGINIDFEQLSAAEKDNFSDWFKRLTTAFHAAHLLVSVDVPLNDDAFDYEFLGELADAVVVMAYDQHYAAGLPGCIAGDVWFSDGIEELASQVPPAKLIVALGAYGYDWNLATKEAPATLSYAEAMILAADVQADVEATGEEMNPTFTYQDDKDQAHAVWLLDAIAAWNQVSIARKQQLHGFSLWRLGLEDPSAWDFLSEPLPERFDPTRLATAQAEPAIAFNGAGELLNVRSVPADGRRELTFDADLVDYCLYQVLPKYYNVDRLGHDAGKRLALTFDDGPDPQWTPQILQLLRAEHVPGTFFIVGDEAQKNPDIVSREFAEGHLLGNHTFFHSNICAINETRLHMEINLTQRVIESITGRGTKLFRAPYDTDTSPTRAAELQPLHSVCQLGFVIVGGDIDSCDYQMPGADAIVSNITRALKPDGPNIVVLHDGGGDRHQTLEALRKLIPRLKAQGYEFVSVERLMGVERLDLMPAINRGESLVVCGSRVFTWLRTQGWVVLETLFFATTAISILRIVFLGVMVLGGRGQFTRPGGGFQPPVTVLIPAYNEAKVIRRTLDGVLKTDYPDLQILVVDDGSSDDTAAIVASYALQHPQVTLIAKPNGGKWSALNAGFAATRRDYLVTIDADTIVPPHTIAALIAPFAEPRVDAVCGNVQVGNIHNILTAFQDLEYVTTQNYDRRAFHALNCISVVPGATGAWRRQRVLDAGGYSPQTLTEDADLTLTLLASGARIVYAPDARSVTEAPDTCSALFKQRLRWSFGTFQCLWKHRRQLFKGTLGWVAMPNLLCFQVVYPLLSPIGDLVFVLSLLRGDFGAVAIGYLMFLAMDLLGSLVAFRLDGRSPRTLWVVLIQRFFYRQFMYLVAFRSILEAIKGGRQAWNKLDRKGSVALPAVALHFPLVPAANSQAALPDTSVR